MIEVAGSSIITFSVHQVNSKMLEQGVHLSKRPVDSNEDLNATLNSYFTLPFKSGEYFNFYHESDINLNEVFVYVSNIFDNPECLHEQSVSLAKHLYEHSVHPKIRGGEFYTVYFKDCIVNGTTCDAVGLFKSENKDTFLKVYPAGDGFEIESQQGVNINKLDKGCLIFNTEKESGYVVAVVDNINRGAEARYWINDFLHVRPRKDEYHHTQNVLTMCKNFITKELPTQYEVSKADQADYLNKSVKFFKENEEFDMSVFANEVIAQPDVIEQFNQFKKEFEQSQEVSVSNNFTISTPAVKKQSRIFKSVIKLDRNFHIYVHGNRQLIEQGKDENGRKYYKIYYEQEA